MYSIVNIDLRIYKCNTFSNDGLIRFTKGVSIIINLNFMDILYEQKHGSHINTFKKDEIDDSFKTIHF